MPKVRNYLAWGSALPLDLLQQHQSPQVWPGGTKATRKWNLACPGFRKIRKQWRPKGR